MPTARYDFDLWDRLLAVYPHGAAEGTRALGEAHAEAGAEDAPVETGKLQSTVKYEPAAGNPLRGRVVAGGPEAPYAVPVHEGAVFKKIKRAPIVGRPFLLWGGDRVRSRAAAIAGAKLRAAIAGVR